MFTEKQTKIHKGLGEIGPEIANFYADAIRLVDPSCTIASKANLIAHLAREIDGGLRDILAPAEKKKAKEKELSGPDKGHFASILVALGKDKDDPLANEWLSIAIHFAKIAHRRGPHKPSKETTEILLLWERYEEILSRLIGSFYSITDRLDHLVTLDNPTEEILSALENILSNEKYANYFFVRLDRPGWVEPLAQRGYFDIKNAPLGAQPGYFPGVWFPVHFLLNVAKTKNVNAALVITKILRKIQSDYVSSNLQLSPYTVSDISNLILELEDHSFDETDSLFFEKFTVSQANGAWLFFAHDLSKKLPRKLTDKGDKPGAIAFLKYFFGIHYFKEEGFMWEDLEVEGSTRAVPLMETFLYKEFTDNHSKTLTELLRLENIRIVSEKLKQLQETNSFELSTASLPSIEVSEQTHMMSEWPHYFVNYIVAAATSLNDEELKEITEEFIFSDTQVLQRIGFHFIRLNFPLLKDVFWQFISATTLTSDIYIHEPFLLLKEHSEGFDEKGFSSVVKWIEGIQKQEIKDQDTVRVQQTKDYYCKRWLSSLKAGNDENQIILTQKSQEYNERYPYEISHPEFDGYSTSSFGFDRPIEDETFRDMSIDDQIQFIKNFKPEHAGDTSDEGLAEQLKESVTDNPENYIFRLDKFLVLSSIYTQDLLEGLTKTVSNGTLTDFNLVLDFVDKVLISEEFKIKPETRIDYRRAFVMEAGEFAKTVVLNQEKFSLTREDLMRIINLLINLLNLEDFKDQDETISHDYSTHILNSTQGRLHLALLETTWLWAKLFGGKEEIKWPDEVKQYFSSRLNRNSPADKDYSMILGQQLHTFLWLDKPWVEENILRIFPNANPVHEEYTLSSSLSIYLRPDKRVYDLFQKYGLFDKAIGIYINGSGSLESLCNYALYESRFWDGEKLGDKSILNKILANNNENQIYQLLYSAWKNKPLTKDQTVELWKKIISIADKDKNRFRPVFRALTWLVDIVNDLSDQTTSLLKQSIVNFEPNDREAYQLNRAIFKLADTNIKNAGSLLLQIFTTTDINPSSTSELQGFVEKLYISGHSEIANDICLYVGDNKGSLILKEIFEKYNPFKK